MEFVVNGSEIFNDTDTMKAVIKVRESSYFKDLIEFEVELNGIPVLGDQQGKDITVNWEFLDFKAQIDNVESEYNLFSNEDEEGNRVFYTDSNGLEMQTRIQDQRPNFNLSTVQNISSNYYPVNSAIAMRHKLNST